MNHMPTIRDEDWRYTNLRRLLRKKFSVAGAPTGPVSDAAHMTMLSNTNANLVAWGATTIYGALLESFTKLNTTDADCQRNTITLHTYAPQPVRVHLLQVPYE